MTKWEAHERLKRVRNELEAARFAVAYALERWDAQGGAFDHPHRTGIARTELTRLRGEIEPTFLIRLVAAFEGVLKDYRENGLQKRPARVDLGPLMDSIARKRGVDASTLDNAHAVREYRNDVVHRDLRVPRLDFATCATALGKFLAWLPEHW